MNSLFCRPDGLASAPAPILTLALALLAGAPAQAHDTWFQPLPPTAGKSAPKPGTQTLALGTGMEFPQQQVAVGAASLVRSGCIDGAGRTLPLRTLRETPTALILVVAPSATAATGAAGRLSCWGQQAPFEVELPADKVALYLREINPPAWVAAEWARLQALGLPWKERYAKHARIELGRGDGGSTSAPPVAMAMDVLLDTAAPRVGEPLVFQVLRDGRPLADQAVELRGDMSPFGFWRRTDAEGRVGFTPPLAGRWVLRGTDLRRSESLPDQFESRFFNLAFEVRPPALALAANASATVTATIRSRAP